MILCLPVRPLLLAVLAVLLVVTPSTAAENGRQSYRLAPETPVNRAAVPENWFVTVSRGAHVEGEGLALYWQTMHPGTETSFAPVPDDRIVYIHHGSVDRYDGVSFSPLVEGDLVYEKAGTKTALVSHDNTADIIEFRWKSKKPDAGEARFPLNKPVNRRYLQYLFPEDAETPVNVVQTTRGHIAFHRLDPGRSFDESNRAEERLIFVLEGGMGMIADSTSATLAVDDIIRITAGSRCLLTAHEQGCSYILFTDGVRTSYETALVKRIASFHSLFPRFAEPKLFVDGRFGTPLLGFTEGPIWLGGRFCFSDQQTGGFHTAGADGSNIVITADITPCGSTLLPNGNAAVCDLDRKSIVEMTPDGTIIGTLTDSFEGKPYSGIPNDVECDARGGLYYTIMSFAEPPGANVIFYRAPDGRVRRVTEPGELGIPNGCILSPDGAILYVNDDKTRHVMAYDIKSDGSLANGRSFATLILHDTVFANDQTKSFADGMTVDTEGNLYVCASGFLQIFSPAGEYRGGFVFPKPAFHLTFGGEGLHTLYVCAMNQVYTLETLATGVKGSNRRYP